MKKVISIMCWWMGFATLQAQENIPIDQWRLHVSYANAKTLALAGEKVYAASNNGLFSYNTDDQSVTTTTKINGLSDVGITALGYHQGTLVIGYSNGNIDLIAGQTITNIKTIKLAQILESKTINNILFRESTAYLCTNFGVLILDLETQTLKESLIKLGEGGANLPINDAEVFNDSLMLATDEGIIGGPLSGEANLLDFNVWKRYKALDGAPEGNIGEIERYNNKLYVAKNNDGVYTYSALGWQKQPYLTTVTFNHLSGSDNALLASTSTSVFKIENNGVISISNSLISTPNRALEDSTGIIWIADETNGLLKNEEQILPTGPSTDTVARLYFHNNSIFALPGGMSVAAQPLSIDQGFNIFTNGQWKHIDASGVPADLIDIAFDPVTQQYAIASFGGGLVLFDGESTFSTIDNTTSGSPLQLFPFTNEVQIPALASDSKGIWMINYGTSPSLHALQNNAWMSHTIATRYATNITIADNGDKWMAINAFQGGGVLVFNEETGKNRLLSGAIGSGSFPKKEVSDIAIDKEGAVWIGTERGIAFISSTFAVDNGNSVEAFTPYIDNFPVLRDEQITALKIDGGNRKWVGTTNGVWLFDAGVNEELLYFNVDNSPLLSNNVKDIEINAVNGEVFFATDKGIASFRADATEATEEHSKVKIYPNPVPPEYQGKVGMLGLANDVEVKITDVSGRLVVQMRSNGGAASWDLKNYTGNKVATGTYFVFSATSDGEETFIGKIAVIN